jgi:hypothetical protein
MQFVLSGLLTILLFVVLLVGQPAAAPFLPPAWAIGGMVHMLATVTWLEGVAHTGVPAWQRLLPAGLLALVLAVVALVRWPARGKIGSPAYGFIDWRCGSGTAAAGEVPDRWTF